jgi:hypothetical protein
LTTTINAGFYLAFNFVSTTSSTPISPAIPKILSAFVFVVHPVSLEYFYDALQQLYGIYGEYLIYSSMFTLIILISFSTLL